jgi:hypothetical protein
LQKDERELRRRKKKKWRSKKSNRQGKKKGKRPTDKKLNLRFFFFFFLAFVKLRGAREVREIPNGAKERRQCEICTHTIA